MIFTKFLLILDTSLLEGQVPQGLLRQDQPEGVRRDQGGQEVAPGRQQRLRVALQDAFAGEVAEVEVKVPDEAGMYGDRFRMANKVGCCNNIKMSQIFYCDSFNYNY